LEINQEFSQKNSVELELDVCLSTHLVCSRRSQRKKSFYVIQAIRF